MFVKILEEIIMRMLHFIILKINLCYAGIFFHLCGLACSKKGEWELGVNEVK